MTGTTWAISAEAAFVDDGRRVVVLSLTDPAACRPYVLEDTAAVIWRAVDGSRETEIIQIVATAYEMERADVADDVRSFLQQLVAGDLLRAVN
jgi:hypothetical protein